MSFIKPHKLSPGDKIATVSPSWGIAGESDACWRYHLAAQRMKEHFGLECVTAPNSMRGEKYLHENPQARAEDFMWAFSQPDIKGIIANIGGNDSIRLLPHINENIIRNNPKVFIGYSDILNLHFMCMKVGLSTFYGANLLTTFGEPQGIHPYTINHFKKVLFNVEPIGIIDSPESFCCDAHDYKNKSARCTYHPCDKYKLLQGSGIVQGKLFGVHTGIMEIKLTPFLAPLIKNNNIILFFEDIVECVWPNAVAEFFIWLSKKNIMQNVKGLLIGRFNEYPENPDYKNILVKTMSELGLEDLPILFNMPFGHTSPICTLKRIGRSSNITFWIVCRNRL